MVKLQYLALVTAISIVGISSLESRQVNASVAKQEIYLGQNIQASKDLSSEERNSNLLSGDRNFLMLAQKSPQQGKSAISEDMEMIETIQKRDEKIQNLKQLQQIQNIFDQEKLKTLEQKNINLKNAAELQTLKATINNEDLADEEILEILREQDIDIDNAEKLDEIRKIVNAEESQHSESLDLNRLSPKTAFRLLAIGIPATILVFLIVTPFIKGTFGVVKENVDEKFGKPKVPEGSVTLHNKAFKEISAIGTKAEKINDNKFGNEEFKLLIQIKINITKKTSNYEQLGLCVDLLKAAIIAQKSFIKLESTELRYRSRKQQEFYQYVADCLEEDINKEDFDTKAFVKKVKKKQTEILPLINTEEGRNAVESYIKEINNIGRYDLCLKLLALFKKYNLQDFSILKKVSDVVERLQGEDLLSPKDLVSLVLENYDAFEQLAPILSISESEVSPNIYAKILQVMGLENRHGKSYLQFKQLVEVLKSWEKPYKTIAMVRKEYANSRYQFPKEFEQKVPGIDVYSKYAEYLPDL